MEMDLKLYLNQLAYLFSLSGVHKILGSYSNSKLPRSGLRSGSLNVLSASSRRKCQE